MGYAKYYEDNEEIMIGRFERSEELYIARTPVEHYICPYCNLIEYTQEALFEHIKKEHNITHPVIVLNGKVINQEEYSVATIDSLSIFTYGFADIILLNEREYTCSESGSTDLSLAAKEEFEENDCIQIRVGEKSLLIKRFSMKEIRVELINPVIREWEKSISEGIMIDLEWHDELNEAECEYLKGFYNYFVACISEGDDKRDRYYDAYTILNGFNSISSLGICVLKVIAFKFNWVNTLKKLCSLAKDEFNSVCDFYDDVNEPLNVIIIDYQNSLYIEDNIRECLDAINNYMFGNLSEAENYVNKYKFEEISDITHKDRILVLLSRLAQASNNLKKARYYNGQILLPDLQRKY